MMIVIITFFKAKKKKTKKGRYMDKDGMPKGQAQQEGNDKDICVNERNGTI